MYYVLCVTFVIFVQVSLRTPLERINIRRKTNTALGGKPRPSSLLHPLPLPFPFPLPAALPRAGGEAEGGAKGGARGARGS